MAKKSVDSPVTRREEAAARRAHRDIHAAEQRERDAAFDAAKEKSESHNDLILAMERQASSFATRDALDALTEKVNAQVEPLRRLMYMAVGMAVLMPIVIGVILALTRKGG